MDRRQFLVDAGLKLTGLMAATSVVGALTAAPAAAAPLTTAPAAPADVAATLVTPPLSVTRLAMPEAGEYRVSGFVRLESPVVEISGLSNSKQISWSGAGTQVVPFTSFEMHEGFGPAPSITVRGGRLESVTVTQL